MSDLCTWFHLNLETLPLYRYPFNVEALPKNGIYFFYEKREISAHNQDNLRIVRIGTHRQDNFQSRICDHFLLKETKMNFDRDMPKPSDRSIFRKNIGRALLNRKGDDYLDTWNIDFTSKKMRRTKGHIRNIQKEKDIELEIASILRKNFYFRFLIVESQFDRMGSGGLENSLIGMVSRCTVCRPSPNWLGRHSPIEKIKKSGLWQIQHLDSEEINEVQKDMILEAIRNTKDWL